MKMNLNVKAQWRTGHIHGRLKIVCSRVKVHVEMSRKLFHRVLPHLNVSHFWEWECQLQPIQELPAKNPTKFRTAQLVVSH